jgi:transcriptional regulator of acetoin/glycerol metabolism
VAAHLLCLPRSALPGRAFGELFDRRLQSLFARPSRQRADLVEMCSHVGLQVMARFEGEAVAAAPLARVDEGHGAARSCPLPDPPANMRELERQAIERALASLDGNVSAAARQLGISRNPIYRRRDAASP